jgi:chromosomal replication initiation ATPase DnaA
MPDTDIIIEFVSGYYKVSQSETFKSRRGQTNQARNTAIYLTRKLRKDTLKEVGVQIQIQNERTVRSVIERMRKQLAKDRRLVREMEKIIEIIQKGQKSTITFKKRRGSKCVLE